MVYQSNQRTIRKEISYEGIGIHTGSPCKLIFKPAPPDSGIVFIRTDLPQPVTIPAKHFYVIGAIRGTTIGIDSTRIHTVEHVLSALNGLGIDNLIIELNNNEPPVADGSVAPFVKVLQEAGFAEQDAPRRYLTLNKTIKYASGNTSLLAEPSENLVINCTIYFDHPLVGQQSASFEITPETYLEEITPARTFCFDYELETLKKQGLIKGGSLDNAIVIGMDKIHNKEKTLRFPNEFVRHKILDFLGDIYLIGYPLKAKITAVRSGHKYNIEFVKQIVHEMNLKVPQQIKPMKQDPTTTQPSQPTRILNINEIMEVIPHRHPMLLIDRVTIIEEEKRTIGYKAVSGKELFFQGHFPGRPIMPGIFIVEAMAQTACVLLLSRPGLSDRLPYFIGINEVKFRKPVVPGELLELRVDILRGGAKAGKARGEAWVGNEKAAEAEFTFVLVKKGEQK